MPCWFPLAFLLVSTLAGGQRVPPAAPPQTRPLPAADTQRSDPLPVVAEHRYRMAAKIRPLLLFWVGKDNVGGARIRWRQGEGGARGYDILIGSDPARAPRRINRWGFLQEETRGTESTMVGVMKRSDEDTLDAAKAGVANEGRDGFYFKMIQGRATATESVATVTITRVSRDYTYRELELLMRALLDHPGEPRIRRVAQPPYAGPGFLTGLVDLLQDTVDHVVRDRRVPGPRRVAYAYYGKQYDLARLASSVLNRATFGGRTYARLVQAEFELRARGSGSGERFTIACGLDGPLAGVPVFIGYQPKWWFRAELVLDERETF